MECAHFEAGRCRSCTWLPRPYESQVAAKQEECAALLAGYSGLTWLEPQRSREAGFRNKAKMVVSGTAAEPALGILGESNQGSTFVTAACMHRRSSRPCRCWRAS